MPKDNAKKNNPNASTGKPKNNDKDRNKPEPKIGKEPQAGRGANNQRRRAPSVNLTPEEKKARQAEKWEQMKQEAMSNWEAEQELTGGVIPDRRKIVLPFQRAEFSSSSSEDSNSSDSEAPRVKRTVILAKGPFFTPPSVQELIDQALVEEKAKLLALTVELQQAQQYQAAINLQLKNSSQNRDDDNENDSSEYSSDDDEASSEYSSDNDSDSPMTKNYAKPQNEDSQEWNIPDCSSGSEDENEERIFPSQKSPATTPSAQQGVNSGAARTRHGLLPPPKQSEPKPAPGSNPPSSQNTSEVNKGFGKSP